MKRNNKTKKKNAGPMMYMTVSQPVNIFRKSTEMMKKNCAGGKKFTRKISKKILGKKNY